MQCKHGIILYGKECLTCQRDFKQSGVVNSEGQLKSGDTITIIGKSASDNQITTVKEIILVDGREEVIINKPKNRYFITSMLLDGSSWAASVTKTC
ncbi:hypothetical protein [Shewanella algae]|uniref:hypothetical protein n=1 Tax=Shewanella algae TaxID=38313 RepID=UPI0031F51FCA